MQIVHTVNWCTWFAHTLCKGLIWNYKDCWAVEHSLDFHLGSCKRFDEVEHVSGNLFLLIWYTLMKNKHQISLYLGLKKMANTLQITFSNGFSFKKNYCMSVCLFVCAFHTFFTMFPSWNFQEWLPMTEVMYMQKFKVRSQKSRLQRSKPKLAVSRP